MKLYFISILFVPLIYLSVRYYDVGTEYKIHSLNTNDYDLVKKSHSYRSLYSNFSEHSSYSKQYPLKIYKTQTFVFRKQLDPQDLLDVFIAKETGSTDLSYDYDNSGVVDSDDVTRAYLLWKEDTHMLDISIECLICRQTSKQ